MENVDKRKFNGRNKNAGRKSKAEELKVRKLGIDAITEIYGSVEKYYQHIAKESKDSFPHLKLLQEYVFGKPKETVENINHTIDNTLSKDEIKALKSEILNDY